MFQNHFRFKISFQLPPLFYCAIRPYSWLACILIDNISVCEYLANSVTIFKRKRESTVLSAQWTHSYSRLYWCAVERTPKSASIHIYSAPLHLQYMSLSYGMDGVTELQFTVIWQFSLRICALSNTTIISSDAKSKQHTTTNHNAHTNLHTARW